MISEDPRPAPPWADLDPEPWEWDDGDATGTVRDVTHGPDDRDTDLVDKVDDAPDQRDEAHGDRDLTVWDRFRAVGARLEGRSERPKFVSPLVSNVTKNKISPLQWWVGLSPATKWFGYHLTGLAAGWAFGVMQYAESVVFAITQEPKPLYASQSAWFFGLAGVALLAVDRRVRGWFWPVAWPVRAVTVSCIVGAYFGQAY